MWGLVTELPQQMVGGADTGVSSHAHFRQLLFVRAAERLFPSAGRDLILLPDFSLVFGISRLDLLDFLPDL